MTLTEHARDTLRRLATRVDDQLTLLLKDKLQMLRMREQTKQFALQKMPTDVQWIQQKKLIGCSKKQCINKLYI